jgi:membrane protein
MSFFSFTIKELKELNLKKYFTRLYTKAFQEEDLTSVAAQVAFYFAFALFPLLLFMISLFGIVLESAEDLRAEMFYYLHQVMPNSAYDLVKETIEEVTESSSGGKLTFGLLAALWSASAGIDSIRVVLNGVYNVNEERSWIKTKLLSLTMTLGLGVLVTIALGIIFYGGKLLSWILGYLSLPISSPFLLGLMQVIVVLTVLVVIFALVYNYLPNHRNFKWTWVTPGAILSIILWLIVSYSFKIYLGYFDSYDKTYGSLGAVIILMLWLYLTALVILFGGTINAVLQEFTDEETAEAGANKAAAKEIVENPDKNAASAKKAETLSVLNKDPNNESESQESSAHPRGSVSRRDDFAPAAHSDVHKSKFKLAAGLVIGFIQNLRKR